MRSSVLVLAIGLLAAESALAGPCQIRRSTSGRVTVTSSATSEIASTVLGTSTNVLFETTTAATIIAATTDVATTTTIVADATTTTSEAETSTSVETTTTDPGPTATYSLAVSGGPIDGAKAQGVDQDGSLLTSTQTFQDPNRDHSLSRLLQVVSEMQRAATIFVHITAMAPPPQAQPWSPTVNLLTQAMTSHITT
ncbi:hypothetical protein KAF25_003810 [Fusarium avenaceum]|uniref:Uncharacterized protein n=1 Tax=Fusarium avenaceum TaxID=40199 RepID=A0A9P7H5M1_9HYPO|nr:hypothetical protein KAF25_003810 [Fusarium avenaceum]